MRRQRARFGVTAIVIFHFFSFLFFSLHFVFVSMLRVRVALRFHFGKGRRVAEPLCAAWRPSPSILGVLWYTFRFAALVPSVSLLLADIRKNHAEYARAFRIDYPSVVGRRPAVSFLAAFQTFLSSLTQRDMICTTTCRMLSPRYRLMCVKVKPKQFAKTSNTLAAAGGRSRRSQETTLFCGPRFKKNESSPIYSKHPNPITPPKQTRATGFLETLFNAEWGPPNRTALRIPPKARTTPTAAAVAAAVAARGARLAAGCQPIRCNGSSGERLGQTVEVGWRDPDKAKQTYMRDSLLRQGHEAERAGVEPTGGRDMHREGGHHRHVYAPAVDHLWDGCERQG